MKPHEHILSFLSGVQRRLNQARLARVVSFTLLAVSLALTAWCLWWIAQGYAVPKSGYGIAALALPVIALAAWLSGLASRRGAAHAADEHFGLKDAISSHLGFSQEGREGEFVALQAETTAERVQQLSAASIPVVWPRRVFTIACVLMVSCLLMSFRKASPVVLERIALEEETVRKSEEVNKELEKEIEDLIKSASDEEKELLQPDEWRRWVQELKETKDQKQAMRQYAELERRLAEAAQKLNQRENEQLLSKAAEEMKQAAELKPIAKSLDEQNYRQAAQQLKQMSLKADVQKPDEARKELAKLKSAAQRMAAAARNFQQRNGNNASQSAGQQNQSNQSQNSQKSGEGQQAQGSQGSSGQQGMDQQMTALEKAVQDLQQMLQQPNPNASQCQSCQNQANQALDKLCQSMCQCSAKRDVQKKLQSLCQCTSMCQGFMCDKDCQSLAQCQNPGKKAGSSSLENRRDGSDPSVNNGNQQQLTGQKGAGPSDTSTESADTGSGRATQTARLQEKAFKRQMESFIQREDVPAEVKEGVKEYFKGIQQVTPEPASPAKP